MKAHPFQAATAPLEKGPSLIEASAGTGKTFTIAALYLRLVVEERVEVPKILVVTFTNDATCELRGRIRARLREVHDGLKEDRKSSDDDEFLQAILERYRRDPTPNLRLLNRALLDFDRAPIFTIHGFCQRVLRDRAFTSRSPFDTELVARQEELLNEAAQDFWRRHFYAEDDLGQRLALCLGIMPKDLAEMLAQFLNNPTAQVVNPSPDCGPVLRPLRAAFRKAQAIWRKESEAIRLDLKASNGLSRAKDQYREDCIATYLAGTDAWMSGLGDPDGWKAMQMLTPSKFAQTKLKDESKRLPSHPFFGWCEKLGQAAQALADAMAGRFLREGRELLQSAKSRRNVQSYDDLLVRFHDALKGERGGEIARAIRKQYAAALIDEFQDTDPIQCDIFTRLFRTGSPNHWFYLVGDPKQSIYRFRGADIFNYGKVTEPAGGSDPVRHYTLQANYRSEPALVEAINGIFSAPNPFHLKNRKNDQPLIQFTPARAADQSPRKHLEDPAGGLAPLVIWPLVGEGDVVTVDEATEQAGAAVVSEILRLLKEGQARIGGRPVRPPDIAVLTVTNREARFMQKMLLRRQIPVVLNTTESVLQSREAREVTFVLQAVANPHISAHARAAFATDLLGLDAAALAEGEADARPWKDRCDRMARHHAAWVRRGFLPMYWQLLNEEGIRQRVLAFSNGERRLTNLLHLGELLNEVCQARRLGPSTLVRWLLENTAADADSADDESQLRLESDEDAVRVVTVHRSKGLEYPIVFCPFAWRHGTAKPAHRLRNFFYHDAHHDLFFNLGKPISEEVRRWQREEELGDGLRQLYVAFTRARHRCYASWGKFRKDHLGALNYLGDEHPERWKKDGTVALVAPPPESSEKHLPAETPIHGTARQFKGHIDREWGITAFSRLTGDSPHELPDHDAQEKVAEPEVTEAKGIHRFPRGTQAGTCLHAIFEDLDFVDPGGQASVIGQTLDAFGLAQVDGAEAVPDMVRAVLEAQLAPEETSLHLSGISRNQRLNELGFICPLKRIEPGTFAQVFARNYANLGRADFPEHIGRLNFSPVRGYLSGFIDLVFRHGGRYYLVDWKSNWIAPEAEGYTPEKLKDLMISRYYVLQYHLYALALHRHLARRLPDYDYEKHFGGAIYIFLRGVTPGRPMSGIFFDRPTARLIEDLEDALLEKGGAR